MSQPIENYGFIGNMVSGALVGRDGSIDWLCLPRFDSDACFAALLGTPEHGRWLIAPDEEVRRTTRRYRPGTAILETTFETAGGAVTLIDFMPLTDDEDYVDVVRIVRGDRGRVPMRTELIVRFGYGRHVPWVRREEFGLRAIAGPDAVELHTHIDLRGENFTTLGEFAVGEGESVSFTLAYHPSHRPLSRARDCQQSLTETAAYWCEWSGGCRFEESPGWGGEWREAVARSLITLKLLEYAPTGGIIAAPTTSLPERLGGVRNWDYRYCWIRDATLTLYALLTSGYREEARAWREWLLRAEAGSPADLQIMYGIAGERRLMEFELPWLPGYENSRPVRVGNAAYCQRQIDVYGELMDAMHVARKFQLEVSDEAWRMQRVLMENLERIWREPDEGIWEMRGPRRHFTHSKLMAWVAFDRAVKAVEMFGRVGPVERWRRLRDVIHADICRNGYSEEKNAFVQYYGGRTLDASLLLMAEMGFLPPEDPRFRGTVEAIERELMFDGLVLRYRSEDDVDGLPGGEGAFLACSFWLADAYEMMGRHGDAERLFEHLLSLRNDLGLLAEEYDPRAKRQLGNFPQGFSHIGLVNTANNLISSRGPAEQRADRQTPPPEVGRG
ncbi:MAG TPA: glycoside hydrolase family 15 protein [Geminicoccaceae bacterium]|nr:glycoside hydrolase family 15 protein [Geminicoccaceae bacterium]